MQRGAWLALKADHATLDLGSCEFKPYIGGRVYLIKKNLIYAEKKYMQENYFEATEQLSGRKTTLPRLSPRCKPLHSVLKKKNHWAFIPQDGRAAPNAGAVFGGAITSLLLLTRCALTSLAPPPAVQELPSHRFPGLGLHPGLEIPRLVPAQDSSY